MGKEISELDKFRLSVLVGKFKEFKELDSLLSTYAIESQLLDEASKEMDKAKEQDSIDSAHSDWEFHLEKQTEALDEIKEELAKQDPEIVEQFLSARKTSWDSIKENVNTKYGYGAVLKSDVRWQKLAVSKAEMALQSILSKAKKDQGKEM